LGQCVFSSQSNDEFVQINLSDWSSGLYLLKVQTENGVLSSRFVVSH